MTKTSLILLMSLAASAGSFAQGSSGGITMSTDPAKVAAVEKHAQELKARPPQAASAKPAAKQSSSHKAKAQSKSKQPQATAKPAAKPAAKTKSQPPATK